MLCICLSGPFLVYLLVYVLLSRYRIVLLCSVYLVIFGVMCPWSLSMSSSNLQGHFVGGYGCFVAGLCGGSDVNPVLSISAFVFVSSESRDHLWILQGQCQVVSGSEHALVHVSLYDCHAVIPYALIIQSRHSSCGVIWLFLGAYLMV